MCVVFLAVVVAGCGDNGIEGTFRWQVDPHVGAHALNGRAENTTSHSLTLDPHAMRLLDDHGRKVAGRIHVAPADVPAHTATAISATWKSGNPVRIDYGSGTLALPSP